MGFRWNYWRGNWRTQGAHGVETADFLDEIEWMDMDGILHSTPKNELEFRYRYSELNGKLGKIITRVLEFNESDPETVEKKHWNVNNSVWKNSHITSLAADLFLKKPPGDYGTFNRNFRIKR